MEDLEIISATLGVQVFTNMPDGWDYLTKNLSSPRGADWIYNNKCIVRYAKHEIKFSRRCKNTI